MYLVWSNLLHMWYTHPQSDNFGYTFDSRVFRAARYSFVQAETICKRENAKAGYACNPPPVVMVPEF